MELVLKKCTTCSKEKTLDKFRSRGGKYSHLIKGICNSCLYEKHKLWVLNNPDRVKEYRKKDSWTLIKRCSRRGISPQELIERYESQGECCPICHLKIELMDSAIDHNHKTNEFRGLLCKKCNRALGLFGDNLNTIFNAYKYLNERGSYGCS
jgi:hypothetical protein